MTQLFYHAEPPIAFGYCTVVVVDVLTSAGEDDRREATGFYDNNSRRSTGEALAFGHGGRPAEMHR